MTGPPMILQGVARYPVREIILHCSATRPDWLGASSLSAKRAEIRRWHVQDRGWRTIGYHWLIDFDGQRAAGRPETDIGAHVVDHNRGTIGICLIGGHGADADDQFGDHFTSAQARTLRALIGEIRGRTQIARVTGHNDYATKACPGFRVAGWI
jgi:N-acetylmuramoyl-L-alanine amidase